MTRDSTGDRCPDLRNGHGADRLIARRVPGPIVGRDFLFSAIGSARAGWQVRAYGDPGRHRRVRVEWIRPCRCHRRPTPAWVRDWIWKFARR
jgi:hypothetical protein